MEIQYSIIIAAYNSKDELEICLRSLYESGGLDHTEIIVVDNSSMDDCVRFVRESYPEIHLICNSDNLGFGGANNLGARHALGKYLVFLNPDTEVTPGWLKALTSALDSDPRVDLATPKILLLSDRDRINACGLTIHITGIGQCRGIGKPAHLYDTPEEIGAIIGTAFVIRKEIFDQIQGFDEILFLYAEDTGISWRARLVGYRCAYIPSALIYHNYSLRFFPKKLFFLERNRLIVLLKCLHWATILVLFPVLLLAEVIGWSYAFLYDRSNWRNKWDAYAWIANNWTLIMEKRRQVQAHRVIRDRQLLKHVSYRLTFEQVKNQFLQCVAHLIFDPIFLLWLGIMRLVVWW